MKWYQNMYTTTLYWHSGGNPLDGILFWVFVGICSIIYFTIKKVIESRFKIIEFGKGCLGLIGIILGITLGITAIIWFAVAYHSNNWSTNLVPYLASSVCLFVIMFLSNILAIIERLSLKFRNGKKKL